MDVRTLCLGVLARGDATGYEIHKAFAEGPLAHFQTAAFGSIYPALKGLLADGLICASETPAAPGSRGPPARKTYRVTQAGLAALDAALAEPPGPDQVRSDFCFVLYFAERLPRGRVRTVLETRIEAYRRCIADMHARDAARRQPKTAGERFLFELGLTHYEAVLAYLEDHKESLIAQAPPDGGAPAGADAGARIPG